MDHLGGAEFLLKIAGMLAMATVAGDLARRFGQPAVLGELLAGVLLGGSVLGVVDPGVETFHLLSELGVVILLLSIGLETDLGALLKVGGTSAVVAVVGVAAPFGLGYAGCRLMGLEPLVSLVAGATLTATSVGITARVLSDLGRLNSSEGRVILGAAVLDDILGLMILAIVGGLADGGEATIATAVLASFQAFGFLVATLVVGRVVLPKMLQTAGRFRLLSSPAIVALILALGLAWAAEQAGSALIIGAFAAGVLLSGTSNAKEIEHGVSALGQFFIPLFFVTVGASVDLFALDPRNPEARLALGFGAMLIAVGVVGKLVSGYAPFWFQGDKRLVGVGMIPRGEVGLIFAQMGLSKGVLDAGLFGAVMLMVIVTTFLAPPLMKRLVSGMDHDLSASEIGGTEFADES